jgi:hypothetical protein
MLTFGILVCGTLLFSQSINKEQTGSTVSSKRSTTLTIDQKDQKFGSTNVGGKQQQTTVNSVHSNTDMKQDKYNGQPIENRRQPSYGKVNKQKKFGGNTSTFEDKNNQKK